MRIFGFAHRAGGHRPHATGFEPAQFFAEARQGLPATIKRELVERAALQAFRQTYGFSQGLHFLDHDLLAAPDLLANHHAKRVGAQVNGRK
ncbi:hypothetical protein D3C73_1339820 [compost metagenome]